MIMLKLKIEKADTSDKYKRKHKVKRNGDSQKRFGHRKSTTSSNKIKDTPIKHGYHLEDYNRHVVYEHYYDNEDLPFYVGEGTLQRAFVLGGNRRTSYYNEKAKDINLIKVKIIAIDITTEEAIKLETELINKYKKISDGGSLINVDYKRGGGLRICLEKPVYQFTIWGEFIAEYRSAAEASHILGLNMANICSCCKGIKGHNTCGGFKFRYYREFETYITPPKIKFN